jgi:hypothetical protein
MKLAVLFFSLSFVLSAVASDSPFAPQTSIRPKPRPVRSLAPVTSIRPVPRPHTFRSQMRSTFNSDGSVTFRNPEISHQGNTLAIDSGSDPLEVCRGLGFEKQLEFSPLIQASEIKEVILLEVDRERAVYQSRAIAEITCLLESQRQRVLHVKALLRQSDGAIRIEEPKIQHGNQRLALSAQAYPSDLCRLIGINDVEVSTVFSRGFPGSQVLLINQNGVADTFYDEEVGAIVCREQEGADHVSSIKPVTTIYYQEGDFRPSFFLSRGIRLIKN